MSEDIFADRKQVENNVRLSLIEAKFYIDNAISNGLYPDGLPVNLYNVRQVSNYSVTVLANLDDTTTESEDGTQDT